MNILCVIDSLGSGGAQRQLVELAKGLKEKGYAVSFLVYHEENFFKSALDEIGIQVNPIIESNYIRRLLKIRRYIRKGKYDVVLSFLEAANFICEFAGLPWRKWKLIVGERSANPNIFRSFKLRFFRWFHLCANFIVSNSYANLKIVRKINPLLASKKCKVIYNIVDFDMWKPATDYVPFKNGKLNLLVVASHQYLKNAKGLVEAVHSLCEKDKLRLKIDWYGDESPDNSYTEAIQSVNRYGLSDVFQFHKTTKDICSKIQHADIIGLFSFYEGLPNIICESMVLGKPIISSSVSDIVNLIDEQKLLFNPYMTKEILNVLLYILALEKKDLFLIGEKNRNLGIKLFKKEIILESYINLLN